MLASSSISRGPEDRTNRALLGTALLLGLFVVLRLVQQSMSPPDQAASPGDAREDGGSAWEADGEPGAGAQGEGAREDAEPGDSARGDGERGDGERGDGARGDGARGDLNHLSETTRETATPDPARGPATRLSIDGPMGRLMLEREQTGWRVTEPARLELSNHAGRRLVEAAEALASLPIASQEAAALGGGGRTGTSPSSPGVGGSPLTSPEARTWRVRVGRPDGGEATYTLSESHRGTIVVLSPDGVAHRGSAAILGPLLLPPAALATTRLLDLAYANGAQIELRQGARALTLRLLDGVWDSGPAGDATRHIPDELAALRSVERLDAPPDRLLDPIEIRIQTPASTHALVVSTVASGGAHPAICDGLGVTLRPSQVRGWMAALSDGSVLDH